MLSVKVSSKHQIAVPSEARRALGIQAGDWLSVEIKKGAMVLKPRPGSAVERLRGSGRGTYGDPVAHVRALRDEWED